MSTVFWIVAGFSAVCTCVVYAACVAGGRADQAAEELERRRIAGEAARTARRNEWPSDDEQDEHVANLGAC